MNAFVKVNNGTFPNVNFYLAWEGFNTLGYSVTLFEENEIDSLPITNETPVFAGTTVFRKVVDKLGFDYAEFDCYPPELTNFYGRSITKTTLGKVREKFNVDSIPVFVKPVKPKQFVGVVLNSILELIPISAKPDDVPVYVSEPINILSEYRVYVQDGEVLGVKHYYGDWSIVPNQKFIESVVSAYKPCPTAYGVDIGILEHGENIVVEVNDACNLGNYGLDSTYYGEMLVSRWFEIASGGIKNQSTKLRIQSISNYLNDDLNK